MRILQALRLFGIVASDVTDLQAAINLYRTKSQNPRQAIITRSQAKKHVAIMVKELIDDLLVGQLDKMVEYAKGFEQEFLGWL